MFNIFKGRRHLIVDEENLTTLLEVLNRRSNIFTDYNLSVGNCGWSDDPNKWFIYFDSSDKGYDDILKDLLEIGSISVKRRSRRLKNLYFTKRS